ncbi:unnamed protein product, partial [marine sediment metagenome]
RNYICDQSLRRAQSTNPELKKAVEEEIKTLTWVLGKEDPYSCVWESDKDIFATVMGNVHRFNAESKDWDKCENSDELAITRAKTMLDHCLAAISKLGVEVAGPGDPGYMGGDLETSADCAFAMKGEL